MGGGSFEAPGVAPNLRRCEPSRCVLATGWPGRICIAVTLSFRMLGCGVHELVCLTERGDGPLAAHVQEAVVRIVFDRQQPIQVARHRFPVGRDLGEQVDGLAVVLAAGTSPKGRATCRIARGDTGEYRERRAATCGVATSCCSVPTNSATSRNARAWLSRVRASVGPHAWLRPVGRGLIGALPFPVVRAGWLEDPARRA